MFVVCVAVTVTVPWCVSQGAAEHQSLLIVTPVAVAAAVNPVCVTSTFVVAT